MITPDDCHNITSTEALFSTGWLNTKRARRVRVPCCWPSSLNTKRARRVRSECRVISENARHFKVAPVIKGLVVDAVAVAADVILVVLVPAGVINTVYQTQAQYNNESQ